MFTLLPLLGKKIEDLSLDDLNKIKKVLKLDITLTPELRDAGIEMLRSENIDTAADLIKTPESIQKLLSIFQPAKVESEDDSTMVVRCPHCHQFFF